MTNHHLRGTIEVEDTLEAYMTRGGKPILFYASNAYAANSPVMIEFQMEKAAVRLENDLLEIRTEEGVETRTFPQPTRLGKNYWGNGHMKCIADFYDSLKNNAPLRNGLESVRDTVDVMLQMYEAQQDHNKH